MSKGDTIFLMVAFVALIVLMLMGSGCKTIESPTQTYIRSATYDELMDDDMRAGIPYTVCTNGWHETMVLKAGRWEWYRVGGRIKCDGTDAP